MTHGANLNSLQSNLFNVDKLKNGYHQEKKLSVFWSGLKYYI